MQLKKFVKVMPFALALGISSTVAVAAPAADAAGMHSAPMGQVAQDGDVREIALEHFVQDVGGHEVLCGQDELYHPHNAELDEEQAFCPEDG